MNGGSEPLPQNAPAWQAPPSNGREQETNSSGREQETNSNDHGQENMLNRFDLKVQKWIDGHTTTPNGEPDAVLHTIEVDDELEDLARSFFDRSPHGYKIRLHIGSALEVVPRLFRELGGRQFDLVFIDGDKREYPAYYKMLMGDATAAMENHKARPMVRHGGIILADNVLWYGKVVNLPEMSEAAGGSGSHEGSGADGTVEASEAHECSDAPNKSKLPNVPKSHDEPGTLERLGTPDAPKSPNTQKSPDAPKSPDRHTAGIVEFNRLVVSDPRVENVILPLRDGINMIRVK